MNERIKQLVDEARVYYNDDYNDLAKLQKFAELSVRECAHQCVQNEYYNAYSIDSLGATKAAKSFKKYFEVK